MADWMDVESAEAKRGTMTHKRALEKAKEDTLKLHERHLKTHMEKAKDAKEEGDRPKATYHSACAKYHRGCIKELKAPTKLPAKGDGKLKPDYSMSLEDLKKIPVATGPRVRRRKTYHYD